MSDTAVVSPTPETQTATPVSTQEPVSNGSGTTPTNGSEAAGAAPSGETFYSGDPNSLPPELKQAYTNMLKDYKTKTQSVADIRKKAEAYDAVSKDPKFVSYWKGLNQTQKADFKDQKAEVEKTLGQKIDDARFQKAFETKDGFLDLMAEVAKEALSNDRKEIETLKQYKAVNEASGLVEQFATEKGKDGQLVRPDFYNLEEDKLITGYLQLSTDPSNGMSQEEYTQKLNEAYAWAKNLSQKYFEKGKSEALQVIEKKVATSTNPPTQAARGAYTGPNPKNLSASEAFQLAKKNIRVPRDD